MGHYGTNRLRGGPQGLGFGPHHFILTLHVGLSQVVHFRIRASVYSFPVSSSNSARFSQQPGRR